MMHRRLWVTLLLLAVCASKGSAQTDSPAWKRLHHLQRGIALSDWLTESARMSLPQLRNYTTPGDIEHIHQLGFDHIRIPIGPDLFLCPSSWDTCERVQILDQVIQKALSLDMAVILDFHPDQQYTHMLDTNEQSVQAFLKLWVQIADHYGSIDKDRVFLEVMNEFNIPDHYRWSGILQEAVKVIRAHAPYSTIIVSGAQYADIWDLVYMPKIADENVIYNFHYYEPHIFTHQGATWSNEAWRGIHNLPFPASPSGIAPALDANEDESVQWKIWEYAADHWDANHISADIEFAATWGKKHNVPLICDEFGAYRDFTSPDDRERWITAVRTALEKNHIGWAAWDYQGGFGIVYKDRNGLRDDDVALRGLGMKK